MPTVPEPFGRYFPEAIEAARRLPIERFVLDGELIIPDESFDTTTSRETARSWLKRIGHGLDGIVAKRLESPYQPSECAMQKFKLWQIMDCVVVGIYYKPDTKSVEYLLMGLHDDAGRLNYIGRCGVGENGDEIGKLLKPLMGGFRVYWLKAAWGVCSSMRLIIASPGSTRSTDNQIPRPCVAAMKSITSSSLEDFSRTHDPVCHRDPRAVVFSAAE
jgi:hypothetical protein